MKKKFLCIVMAIMLAITGVGLINAEPVDAAIYSSSSVDTVVKERLNQLSALDGRYFTTDGKPACGSGASKCEVTNVLSKNSRVRSLNKTNKSGYRPMYNSYLPEYYTHGGKISLKAYSCAGFAMYAEWFLFANKYNNKVETYLVARNCNYNYTNMKKYARVGDVIWTSGNYSSGHASIVISVGSTGVKVIDANTTSYSSSDKGDSRICVHTLKYSQQSRVTISRATNFYIHYSDGLTSTSYTADSYYIHEQVGRHGIATTLQSKKFVRSGYTYSKYYIYKVISGYNYYLCRNKSTSALKWLKSSSITSAYSKVYVSPGGSLVLSSSLVGKGQEIVLCPAWVSVHVFSYSLNGGTGTYSNVTVADGQKITLPSTIPTKSGYTFRGWYVRRLADNTWYVPGTGWCTWNDITDKNLNPKLYNPGESYTVGYEWTKGSPNSNYCFYAQWQ